MVEQLKKIEVKAEVSGHITLKELIQTLGTDGHYVLIFFMILPFLQPIPMMGLSTPFGLMIAIIAVFAFLNKSPWIPLKWADKQIQLKTVQQIRGAAEKILNKILKFFYARWTFFFHGPFKVVNVLHIVINAILLALPLPFPFSNAVPAWGIFFQALANIEDDGLLIIISYIQLVMCILFFGLLATGVISSAQFLAN